MINKKLKDIAIRKASKSICKYKVSAIGLDKNFRIVAVKCNRPRFSWVGGSIHAEIQLMKYPNVKTIIICRINNSGKIKPISPCKVCKEKANELGIKILTIKEN